MSNNEARVLSALLKRQDLMTIMNNSPAGLFKTHKDVWDFIYDFYRKYREVPSLQAVREKFDDFEFIDVPDVTGHYVDLLREERMKDELEKMIQGAASELGKPDLDIAKLAKHFEKRTIEIQRSAGESRSVDVRDIDSTVEHLNKVREYRELNDGEPGIMTGFKEIDDNYATGLAPGHFIVTLGYSGHFKSFFVIKLAINAWLSGHSVMFINLEMTPEELRDRILFLISQYSMQDLVRAEVDPEDFRAWATEFMEGKADFILIGNEGFGAFTTSMVQAKIDQYKPGLVIADYMQLFSDSAMSGSEIERAKRTAREFKQLATATQTPIIVISAVTGKDKKDRLNPPEISQVAWSSEIEYAANLAFAVHTYRDDEGNQGNTEIVCRKNRHGPLFDFLVKMDMDNGVVEVVNPEDQVNWMGDKNFDYLDEDGE